MVHHRSRETGLPIVFVHPAEFLATAPDGGVLARALFGDRLVITDEQRDTATDSRAVFYVDIAIAIDAGMP